MSRAARGPRRFTHNGSDAPAVARRDAEPDASASASGRVNLIGEHTDYNDGFVLPVAIPQRTVARVWRTRDGVVRPFSEQLGPAAPYALGEERRSGAWVDYVAGVTRMLAGMGQELGGFELHISSEVPVGAGLSSSAALELALGRALRDAFRLRIDDHGLADVGRRAENEFVGVRSGVMDQLAAAFAAPDTALLIDCRSLELRPIAMPESAELVVIDSGQRHSLAGGDYNRRRGECEQAARLLGVSALRDVDGADERVKALPPPLDRRVRHVVEENHRVIEAAGAIEANELRALGALLDASHRSQRDLFEVSTAEIDSLVALARERGAIGARLTGGGFGGSVAALAPAGAGREIGEAIVKRYRAEHPGLQAVLLTVT